MTGADHSTLPNLRDPSLLRSQAYVDGKWIGGNSRFEVHDPADRRVIAAVPDLSAADAAAAIAAAASAQRGWAALPANRRAAVLRRWFDLVLANEDDLAVLISAEEGKPLAEALAEVRYGASFIEWFAEEAKRVYGETIPAPSADRRILVLRQPIGVVAAITPWNFPLAMITRKAAAAMAAGCAIVVKPSELTPLTALALAALAERADVPAGILNIITTFDAVAVGQELCSNPIVRKISFTGSTEVGRILLRQSADSIKKCSMELGGNAPVLIFDDADLSAAIKGTMAAKFRNTGQACIAANRILVHQDIYETFAAKLTEEVRQLRVGHGLAKDIAIGPLVDAGTFDKVSRHVANAVDNGARIAIGGGQHALGGTFFEPTVLTGVSRQMSVFREETFGPVAALVRFADEKEAIALANDSEFGLAAYVFTRDLGRALRVSEALEAGMIGLNEGIISTEVAPFGGVKQSGLGREGSRHGIEEYLEIKYICVGGI
jgi:succinate-semialdehyde dehydrogenase/glutarate-semialdehyde dehydrogenase